MGSLKLLFIFSLVVPRFVKLGGGLPGSSPARSQLRSSKPEPNIKAVAWSSFWSFGFVLCSPARNGGFSGVLPDQKAEQSRVWKGTIRLVGVITQRAHYGLIDEYSSNHTKDPCVS